MLQVAPANTVADCICLSVKPLIKNLAYCFITNPSNLQCITLGTNAGWLGSTSALYLLSNCSYWKMVLSLNGIVIVINHKPVHCILYRYKENFWLMIKFYTYKSAVCCSWLIWSSWLLFLKCSICFTSWVQLDRRSVNVGTAVDVVKSFSAKIKKIKSILTCDVL